MSIVAGCDTAEVFELAEHALDGIAVAIEQRREAVFPFAIALGGMFGIARRSSTCRRIALVSYPLSAGKMSQSRRLSSSTAPAEQSAPFRQ